MLSENNMNLHRKIAQMMSSINVLSPEPVLSDNEKNSSLLKPGEQD